MRWMYLLGAITGTILTGVVYYLYIDARQETDNSMSDQYPEGFFLGYNWIGVVEFLSTFVIWSFVFLFFNISPLYPILLWWFSVIFVDIMIRLCFGLYKNTKDNLLRFDAGGSSWWVPNWLFPISLWVYGFAKGYGKLDTYFAPDPRKKVT